MLNKDNKESAIQAVCKENEDAEGEIHEVTFKQDTELWVKWTASTWDNGVPVNKVMERSKPQKLFLPAGTTIKGVSFRGRASGDLIFDFPYGSTWYSIRDGYVEDLLDIE